MKTELERCTECGAPLFGGACGTCAPTGRPVDKGERRLDASAAEHEKKLWDQRLVNRKVHPRPKKGR
jgi:hypothetical protein